MTISYSQLLMDAEMAEMMLFSMDGIVVNDETLSVDVIKEVGPRSDFLAHMNTFENMTALPVTAGTKRGTSTWKAALSLPRRNSSPHGNRNPSLRRHVPVSGQCSTPPNVTTACRKAWSKNKEGEGNRQYCLLLLRVLGHTSISATSPAISGVLDKRAPEDPSFLQSWLRAQYPPSFLNTSPALFPLPAGAFFFR